MNSKSTILVKFLPDHIVVDASHGETLLEAALKADVDLPHSCGGNGTCGTCRVWVVEGADLLPPRNEIEQEMAEDRGFQKQERLCCQNFPVPGLVLQIPRDDFED